MCPTASDAFRLPYKAILKNRHPHTSKPVPVSWKVCKEIGSSFTLSHPTRTCPPAQDTTSPALLCPRYRLSLTMKLIESYRINN
ncbi:hypothetical protein AVEN_25200-1 [Araneus ventricosus]|uniref:Uncharacterized protein n=2 Tax=Araneus ventricosus TaxID=182803 RepID=A0A4Y2L076_ARAVE|nr:hypothetical protein AVEN_25200-1 [Araneus ventricosus]